MLPDLAPKYLRKVSAKDNSVKIYTTLLSMIHDQIYPFLSLSSTRFVHFHLHHGSYAPTNFEVDMSNGSCDALITCIQNYFEISICGECQQF